MKLASGHTYEEVEAKEKERFRKLMQGRNTDMIVLQPGGWAVPRNYLKFQDKVYNFKFKSDDVVIMTYPKCGTTWTQEIVWTMLNNPDLNNPDAGLPLFTRTPFLESDMLFTIDEKMDEGTANMLKIFQKMCPDKNPADGFQVQLAESLSGRRTIKTHFPLSLLAPDLLSTTKLIFVARNPKDACLSFEHHHRIIPDLGFVGNRDDFVDLFVKEALVYGPFHTMLLEAWAKRDHPNMHFIFYEDLKADIDGELKKINDFIGAGLTEQQLKNVKEHTSFSSMKARDPISGDKATEKKPDFFRKGEAGSWKGKLTPEQEAKIDDYTKKHFEGTGLTFKY